MIRWVSLTGRPPSSPAAARQSIGYGTRRGLRQGGLQPDPDRAQRGGKLLAAKEELEGTTACGCFRWWPTSPRTTTRRSRSTRWLRKRPDSFGRIDVLINNAQASASGIPLAMQSKEHFDLGVLRPVRHLLLHARLLPPSEEDPGAR